VNSESFCEGQLSPPSPLDLHDMKSHTTNHIWEGHPNEDKIFPPAKPFLDPHSGQRSPRESAKFSSELPADRMIHVHACPFPNCRRGFGGRHSRLKGHLSDVLRARGDENHPLPELQRYLHTALSARGKNHRVDIQKENGWNNRNRGAKHVCSFPRCLRVYRRERDLLQHLGSALSAGGDENHPLVQLQRRTPR
jgi:hypothetical protein